MDTNKEEPLFVQTALAVIQDLLFRKTTGCNLISLAIADDSQNEPLYTLFFENSENNVHLLPMSHSAPSLQFFVGFLANILRTSHEGVDYDEPIVLNYSEYPSSMSSVGEILELAAADRVSSWAIHHGEVVDFKDAHGESLSTTTIAERDDIQTQEAASTLKEKVQEMLASASHDIMAFFRDIVVANSHNGSHIIVVGSSFGQMEFMYGKNDHDIYNMEGIIESISYVARSVVLGSSTTVFLRSFLDEDIISATMDKLFLDTSQQTLRGWVFLSDGILPLSSQQVIDVSCRDYETGKILDPERNLAYVDAWTTRLDNP